MSWELELSISIKIVLSQLKCRFCTFQASERNCSHRWITKLQTSKFFVTKFYYGIAKLQLHKMDWIKQLSKEFDRRIGRCRQKIRQKIEQRFFSCTFGFITIKARSKYYDDHFWPFPYFKPWLDQKSSLIVHIPYRSIFCNSCYA